MDDETVVIDGANEVEVTGRKSPAHCLWIYDHLDFIGRVRLTERDIQVQHAIGPGFRLKDNACHRSISDDGPSISPRRPISRVLTREIMAGENPLATQCYRNPKPGDFEASIALGPTPPPDEKEHAMQTEPLSTG
jgi:hypothetical protein